MRALAKDPSARFKDADAFLMPPDAAERAPDSPRPEDTAAFAAVSPEGEHEEEDEHLEDYEDPDRPAGAGTGAPILSRSWSRRSPGWSPSRSTRPDLFMVGLVPSVLARRTWARRQESLESEGFDVDLEPRPSNAAPRDTVLEQGPARR